MKPETGFARALAVALVVGLTAAGCASRGPASIPAATTLDAPDPVAQLGVAQQYRLGPGDTVSVRVFRQPELSGDRQIDDQGNIQMPLVGQISAVGLTPAELGETIRQSLGRSYYENPQVDVSTKEALGRRVTIDGAVRTPGMYPVDGNTTLLRAITLAQGPADTADIRRVAIFRTISGQRQAASFDLKAIREGRAEDPPVYGADVIVVDGDGLRLAWREILQALPLIAIFRPF